MKYPMRMVSADVKTSAPPAERKLQNENEKRLLTCLRENRER